MRMPPETRKSDMEESRVHSFPRNLARSRTAKMPVGGKTQTSSGEQLAKAWLGHTFEEHFFCGGVFVLKNKAGADL